MTARICAGHLLILLYQYTNGKRQQVSKVVAQNKCIGGAKPNVLERTFFIYFGRKKLKIVFYCLFSELSSAWSIFFPMHFGGYVWCSDTFLLMYYHLLFCETLLNIEYSKNETQNSAIFKNKNGAIFLLLDTILRIFYCRWFMYCWCQKLTNEVLTSIFQKL